MTDSFTSDTRGTSTVVATVLLIFIIIVSATAAGAYVTNQYREEISDTTEITESKIDTPTHDQVHISPLVGDDLEMETVEVRIEFLDRDAPPAVITDLQAATDHSSPTQVTTTKPVDTAGEHEPVTKTVTSYKPTGETRTEATLPVYNWSKDIEVQKHVYEWRVWDEGDSVAEQQNQTVESATEPTGWDNVRKVGKMKVYQMKKERSHSPGTYKSRECAENDWRDCYYPIVTGVNSWHTTTVTETVYTEAPVQPGDGWTKVSDESVGTKTYTLDEPKPVYEKRTREVVVDYDVTNTTQEVEQTRTVHVADPAAVDSGNVTDGLASVDQDASYLDIDGANSAAGVGGTLGSTHTGTLTQGETVVIQLDQRLLFEGERINVEIIDKDTNSRVLDRNVRVQHPETFQFSPEDGTTVANESAPGSPDVDAPADVPDTSLGDLPDADNPDVDSPETGASAPGDTINSTEDMVEVEVSGANDGNDTEEKIWVEPALTRQMADPARGTVPENSDYGIGIAARTEAEGVDADHRSDPSSNTGSVAASRITGTPRLTGLTGGDGNSGSSGGGSYDGGSSVTRGGVGVV